VDRVAVVFSRAPLPVDAVARDDTQMDHVVRTFSFAFDLDQQSKESRALV